jgi:hypothetical protein
MSKFKEIACLSRFSKEVASPTLPADALAAVEEVRKRWPKFHPGAELICLGESDDGQVLLGIALGEMRVGSVSSMLWSACGTGKTWADALDDLEKSVQKAQEADQARERAMEESRRREAEAYALAAKHPRKIVPDSVEGRRWHTCCFVEGLRRRTVQ